MGILNSLFFKFICFLLLIHALNVKLFKKSASNIFFLQIHSTQEITNNQDNTNIIENFDLNISEESSNNIEETSSENSTTYNNVTLKEKNETNETDKENKPINYDILEDDNYGPEVKDIKSSFKMSETSSLEKISSFTLNLKAKIENMTENLESKINAFTDRITNKSKELDKLMLFNELKTLKLAIEIEKSNMIDIDSEIFQLKSVLAKLLRKSPSSIQTICSLFKTCGECLRNKHCGWCQEQERCMLGNENSPRFELCQFYSYQLCDGNNCLKYKDCSSCLDDPFCGWCVDEESNIEGCIPGLQDFSSCPLWFYSNFLDKPQCPKPLGKQIKIEKEINFEDIPDEQRKGIFQKQKEILEINEKIEKVKKFFKVLEEKIEYYQKKFHDISRTISLEEINDIRNEINLRKLQRKEEMTLKSEKESFQRKNQTESNAQIEQADSEEVLMILDLDDPDTIKILSQSL